MSDKTCKTCGVTKLEVEFPSNGFQPGGAKKYKPECHQCTNRSRRLAHYVKLESVLKELGREVACEMCGYDKYWAALCFHHIDEEDKEFEINKAKTASRERIKTEIEKCALLCHNCHMEHHYPQSKIVVDDNLK